ncbi:MAG: tRNA (guanosine(46)-N7)-methyltransferase TrmB [Spirochaetales bacterium]|uniref:tRNA (guanine-N(7)-)-methyltransferase n=1 Tax=Candidatus Thalassospirochaeta sargassi TaxID=3119039 RepID=A0AAJ1IFX3_9SPIO|nr:tRNA (guanosine(46)-N7)-methyltransferase TrmB [Spirochaetales bacterium]
MSEERKKIKSYVLRASRMSKGQKIALELLSEKYCIEFQDDFLDIKDKFNSERLCIEIGFGMGTATGKIAADNPDMNFLGIEVHKPGVGRLLSDIQSRGLSNLRIINHDAVEVLEKMIPDSSIEGFHIFFPDPWPKKKHHKRRLLNDEFTALLVSKLRPNGYIYAVTDWEDYAKQMLAVLSSNKDLKNAFEGWADSPGWRPQTAFERKGLDKNHIIRELYFYNIE